jgi:hypothetical protein
MRPAILRAMQLPELRQRIAAATTPEQLEKLAAECDRRRSAGAAQAALTARLRCRALKAVATRKAREAARPAAPKRSAGPRPLTLLAFLVRKGGLRDPRGDLRAVMGTPKARVGLMNNRTGRSLDDAARLALAAGYFPEHVQSGRGTIVAESLGGALREGGASAETMTPAILLDAIDAELRGRPRWPNGEAPADAVPFDAARDQAEREAAEAAAAAAWRALREEAAEGGWEAAYAFLRSRSVVPACQEEVPF